ncbi:RagB/SusD family nutrient uptake outer membrane protein [Sphingobacterium bambusae]|uniref:RagB/SusD family nutrient uptake outer membrane protein n=1 Tax=Sphingobacterium bambusae TaxID=662858 RepID=A0ABW6BI83_9SPHI|nr:RagB/SusD family nutrient uptake outer membrane protein [Sphingobacterium bambusae]WPL50902.1 RagB/SusD family nutrient uptake outer membrane protein [Sphingobacterium bambusae]
MKILLNYTLFSLLFFGLFVSCDVDLTPETTISDDNFWNTTADLRLAANYFYTTLPGLTANEVAEDTWSTDAYPGLNGNTISDGSRVAPTTDTVYNYYRIYQANNLIANAPLVLANGANEQQVNWYVGEARFFRAMYYFEKLRAYGGVPLITRPLEVNDPEIYAGRASRDEVLQLIYEDLDFAIQSLRTPDQLVSSGEYGRISNTAAMAFKSRVALFEGTRAKYHGYGDYSRHLTLAKEAAEAVISSGAHSLFSQERTGVQGERLNDAYFNLFQQAGEGRSNRENIIVRVYGVNRENSISSTPVQRYLEGNTVLPTQNFVESYLMADGLPITQSPLYQEPDATTTHASYFNKKDPRMAFTIFKRGDEFITSGNYTIPNPSTQGTGFGLRKYANKEFWNIQASFIDRPVLRYAEVLLNYAEAIFELNGSITDIELNRSINLLRARLPQVNIGTTTNPNFANMPALTNTFVNENGLDMLTEIRRERHVELAFEGFRYWDLIRWKTAEIELPKTILGSYFFNEYTSSPTLRWSASTNVNERNYIILQPSTLRRFDPRKDYLWPLPTDEIAKNPTVLEQNPGWD